MAAAALKPDPQPTVFSVEVKPEYLEALNRMLSPGTRLEDVLAHAVEEYCERHDMGAPYESSAEEMAAVARGIAQADRGEGIPQDEVMAAIKARHGW